MLEIRVFMQCQPPQRSCALGTLDFATHLPLEVRQHLPHPWGALEQLCQALPKCQLQRSFLAFQSTGI